MDVYEAIAARRSIRRYKPDPVGEEQVTRVLDAARLAPSWKNLQCWRFIVVRSETGKTGILSGFDDSNPGKKAITAAPVMIVLCVDPQASGKMGDKEYYLVDAGIAMENLMLAARAEGLGTCWLGEFNEAPVKESLGIPDNWRIVGMTPLGYPDQDPKPRPRKTMEEIVFAERWPD
ncbi:MAG: nitroreductase family protein [Peptococcaceae bacterium]|jgi:nitroreductase|nr:nitroreductase family protein [Peptococcaceae bacterium]